MNIANLDRVGVLAERLYKAEKQMACVEGREDKPFRILIPETFCSLATDDPVLESIVRTQLLKDIAALKKELSDLGVAVERLGS